MRSQRFLYFLPLLMLVGLMVFLGRGLTLDPRELPSVRIDKPLPSFKLPILGEKNQFITPLHFQGKISLLNVWASWCASCVDEQALLLQLSKQGLPVIGLSYKDKTDDAIKWLKQWGNPYQFIAEDKEGKAAIDLGVYGTPETFLIDQKGIIRFRHVGVLDEESFVKDFLPRIKKLARQG